MNGLRREESAEEAGCGNYGSLVRIWTSHAHREGFGVREQGTSNEEDLGKGVGCRGIFEMAGDTHGQDDAAGMKLLDKAFNEKAAKHHREAKVRVALVVELVHHNGAVAFHEHGAVTEQRSFVIADAAVEEAGMLVGEGIPTVECAGLIGGRAGVCPKPVTFFGRDKGVVG